MTPQPQAKPRLQTQKGTKNMQQYLQELEMLLKKNTGTGLFTGEDATSNTPMYIPGKANNPGGIESNAQAISAMQSTNSVIPDFQMPEYPEQLTETTEQDFTQPQTIDEFLQQLNQFISQQQSQSPTGMQSLSDGGVLYSDGLVRYEDGTVREYKDPSAYAFRSNVDGSTGYSDGTTRRPARIEENTQNTGNAIASLQDNRTLYDNGRYSTSGQDYSGVSGLSTVLFGRNQTVTQPYGNVNPIEPTRGNINYGTDFRTRDLENRSIKLPFDARVIQRLEDDGTRFGDRSGHQGYGNSLLVELPNGTRLRLSHLSQMGNFQVGDTIPAQNELGTPGTTGNTYGEHLDVELYDQNGKIANPKNFYIAASDYIKNNQVDPSVATLSPLYQKSNLSARPNTETSQMSTAQNMSVDPRNTSQPGTQPQQSVNTQLSSYNDQNYNIGQSFSRDSSSASNNGAGYNPGQAFQQFTQDVKQVPQKLAGAIDKANPTGEFDLGLTEGTFTPQAAQARMDTAVKFAQPSENRGFMGKFRQSVGNAVEQAGNMAGIPETGISEILAGGKTRQTNQAFASELDQAVQENPNQSLNLKQGIQDVAQQAGQGVKALGQSGVATLGSIFKPKQEEPKRAVGDVPGTADPGNASQFSSLMDSAPSMSQMGKNDVSDPFFKMGGSEMYKQFLKPNAKDLYGGALNMDIFTPDFYKDLGNISSVFGGSKDLGAATEKYIDYEKQKYPTMSRMNYEEGYDRGDIERYNKQVDEYNNSINNYLGQIRSSVSGAKSVFTPVQSSKQNIFAKPGAISQSTAPKVSAPPSISKPQMSMARPSSSPQMSSVNRAPQMSMAPKPSPSFTPAKANMTSAATGRPVVASLSRSAPAPKPAVNMSPAPKMSVAPKPAVNMSPAPRMSVAPKPQSQPKTNVFSKVTSAIRNVFRR